jgi:hypothetical protein
MTLVDDFKDELNISLKIYPYSSNDGKSTTFGTVQNKLCYTEPNTEVINGCEIQPVLKIFVDSAVTVTNRDQVEVGGFRGSIKKIERRYDKGLPYSIIIYT